MIKVETRVISNLDFWCVGVLQLVRNPAGYIHEYSHTVPGCVAKNHYADGPFCQFSLTSAPSVSGVYAVFIEDELRYIGECEDLYRRFGPTGYGRISPRNCHDDGQSTNCKLNSRVLSEAKNGKRTIVWFYPTGDRKAIEARLIFALNPPWNGRMESGLNSYRNDRNLAPYKHYAKSADSSGIPTTEDFRVALIKILNNA